MSVAVSFSDPLFMARWMVSLGMLAPFAFAMASRRRGLCSGSGPLSFTEIVMSLMILEKILDRLASNAPFFRLMVDHLLCPDIKVQIGCYSMIFGFLEIFCVKIIKIGLFIQKPVVILVPAIF